MIRFATPDDALEIQAIYAPIVAETTISFEIQPPTVDEVRRRIKTVSVSHPWLVDERDGQIVGYAYAGYHRQRPAYRWTAETTVYVGESHRGGGVGRGLYEALIKRLRRQGFRTAVAGIALPNPDSIRLHENMGFRPVGVFSNSGFKMGRWIDTSWWQLDLQELSIPPTVPAPPI